MTERMTDKPFDNLVERLREQTPEASGKSYYWGRLMKESADRITEMKAQIERVNGCERFAPYIHWDDYADLEKDEIGGYLLRSDVLEAAQ